MGNCYVYQHMDGSEVVYVGKGTGGRAWDEMKRKPPHKDWMLSKLPSGSFVRIVRKGLDCATALAVESALIEKLKPRWNETREQRRLRGLANVAHLVALRSKRTVTPKGTFKSVVAAAVAHGISQHTASNRARNQIKGWRYK